MLNHGSRAASVGYRRADDRRSDERNKDGNARQCSLKTVSRSATTTPATGAMREQPKKVTIQDQTVADSCLRRRRCNRYSTPIGTSDAITIKITTASMLFLMKGMLPRKKPAMVSPQAQITPPMAV